MSDNTTYEIWQTPYMVAKQGLQVRVKDENGRFKSFSWDKARAGIYRMRTTIGPEQYAILRTRGLILTIYGCGHQLETHAYNLSRYHSVDERDLILHEVMEDNYLRQPTGIQDGLWRAFLATRNYFLNTDEKNEIFPEIMARLEA